MNGKVETSSEIPVELVPEAEALTPPHPTLEGQVIAAFQKVARLDRSKEHRDGLRAVYDTILRDVGLREINSRERSFQIDTLTAANVEDKKVLAVRYQQFAQVKSLLDEIENKLKEEEIRG